MKRSVLVLAMLLALSALPRAENWPQFRGLQGGVAPDDPALPDTWSPTENIAWKLDVPGYAWSSPIVWGDHVFITSAINPGGDTVRPTSEYLAGSLGGTMTFRDLAAPKWQRVMKLCSFLLVGAFFWIALSARYGTPSGDPHPCAPRTGFSETQRWAGM